MPSVIVCGAGVFGASVADRLARSGWAVRLVEPYAPGHVRAGSGGESRLIRCAHGADEWHSRSAARAAVLWDELDPTVRVPSGVAWFAQRADGWEAASERTLRGLGIEVEHLTPDEAAGMFPSLRTDDLEFVLWEPGAGILRAREGVRALVARAVAHGAELVPGRALPPADGPSVRLDDGRVLEADLVVWACGAWLPALFPDLLGGLRITQQDVFFFGATADWATPRVPGWVDYDGAAYGLGDLDGRGVKVAPDAEGPPVDAESATRLPLPQHETLARDYLGLRFPALAGAPLVFTRTCQYEITSDTHFVVAPHPGSDRVWLLGGGSGHGFKHGPALAEQVERWVTGAEAPDPRFALGARAAAGALRTGGGAASPY